MLNFSRNVHQEWFSISLSKSLRNSQSFPQLTCICGEKFSLRFSTVVPSVPSGTKLLLRNDYSEIINNFEKLRISYVISGKEKVILSWRF